MLPNWKLFEGCSIQNVCLNLNHNYNIRGYQANNYGIRLLMSWEYVIFKIFFSALPHKVDLEPGWALPFPGSDKSVVRRTQRYFYDTNSKRPVQVDTYFMVDSIWIVLLMAFFGSIFVLLTKFKWGIQLLLKVRIY